MTDAPQMVVWNPAGNRTQIPLRATRVLTRGFWESLASIAQVRGSRIEVHGCPLEETPCQSPRPQP